MVVQDPVELFQRGTKICGPLGLDDERHIIKKVLSVSVVRQSILTLRAGHPLPFKLSSVEGLHVSLHMRHYCSGNFNSLCSDHLSSSQQHYYDLTGLISPSIPQQSSSTSFGIASGNVQDNLQACAPSASIPAAGGSLVAAGSQLLSGLLGRLAYIFSESSSWLAFDSLVFE